MDKFHCYTNRAKHRAHQTKEQQLSFTEIVFLFTARSLEELCLVLTSSKRRLKFKGPSPMVLAVTGLRCKVLSLMEVAAIGPKCKGLSPMALAAIGLK